MLTAEDIRNITFTKAVAGFKPEEVDVFLDKVESDYIQYERIIREYSEKQEALIKEIEGYKNSQNSIQNVLLSAQKLADQIINDAKQKSAEIVNEAESNISVIKTQEKELVNNFEIKAQERKSDLEKELNLMIKEAQAKCEAITKAAEETIARKQALFEQIKTEVANFKEDITAKYKEHLAILQSIPDSAVLDVKEAVNVAAVEFEKEKSAETKVEEIVSKSESKGFVVEDFANDLSEQEEIDY